MDRDRNGVLLVATPTDEDPIILGAIKKGFSMAKIEFIIRQYYEETGELFQTVEPLLDRLRVDLICGLLAAGYEALSEAVTFLLETAVD